MFINKNELSYFIKKEENMKNFITVEEFDRLNEKEKKLYEITYLDYETKCIPQGYFLKNRR